MFVKPRKASTDPRLRSLLQKAARRGVVPIVERVASRLDEIGDTTWLRSRTVVITFEECWPLASSLNIEDGFSARSRALSQVAQAAKQKDAAGLGALAFAYREGDRAVLDSVPDERALRIVAAALERPDEFFRWLESQMTGPEAIATAANARKYLPVATWEWDKACILAGALLASYPISGAPGYAGALHEPEDFPYWCALDKHTDEGKVALREVAREIRVPYRRLIWASFYLESAVVNRLLPSPWFDAERSWRFARAGMSIQAANEIWLHARPIVQHKLKNAARLLRELVEGAAPQHFGQGSLL